MSDTFAAVDRQIDTIDAGMLLFALAAVSLERAPLPGWFRRRPTSGTCVISREEEVSDVLLRLPQSWNIVDGARCVGLHDDEDIITGDPRFYRGFDPRYFAIVAHGDGERFVLLMLINAAEAALLPERLFRKGEIFERCVFGATNGPLPYTPSWVTDADLS